MFKNTFFMTVSTLVRLLPGVVLFIVLARLLGPEDFGRLMYGFTVATIAVLVIEYGFAQQLLRDIGKAPEQVKVIMGRVFLAKILLTLLVSGGVLGALFLFPKSHEDQLIFGALLLSCILASFADFLNVAFRGIGRFHEETKVATISSLFHFAVLLGLALIGADMISLSQGFVVSRMLNLTLSWMAYRRIIGGFEFGGQSWKTAIHTLKSGFPYAADAGFTNFFSQVDILIVNHYLGVGSVGLYQAGMRFLQGASQFAPVLGNVYLPAIAGCEGNPTQLKRLSKKFNTQMLLLGTAGWAVFTFGGEWITRLIYGEKYAGLTPLWPYIGLLLFLRYVAASQGVLLTASGAQSIRVWAQIAGLAVLLSVAPWLIDQFGLTGMLITLQLTLLTLFFIYFFVLSYKKLCSGFSITGVLAGTGVFSIAILLLWCPDLGTKVWVILSETVHISLASWPVVTIPDWLYQDYYS
jgi:O-antigen/teichoic acid export membrane protein